MLGVIELGQIYILLKFYNSLKYGSLEYAFELLEVLVYIYYEAYCLSSGGGNRITL